MEITNNNEIKSPEFMNQTQKHSCKDIRLGREVDTGGEIEAKHCMFKF